MRKKEGASSDNATVKKSKAPLYISVALLLGAVAAYFFIPAVNEFFKEAWQVLTSDDEQKVQEWVDQFGVGGPLVIILAMTLQMFLLVIPTPLLMIVSVLAYGPFWGCVLIVAAIFVASSTGYLIGAYFGPPLVEKIVGQKTEKKIADFIDDYGFWTVIVTRVSPFLSNDAISLIAGTLRMGYWRFIGATVAGILPLAILIAYLGKEIDRLKTGLIWGSVISIILFGLFVWWDRNRRKK